MGSEGPNRNLPNHGSLSCISTSTTPQYLSMRSGSTVVEPKRPHPRNRSHTTGPGVPSDQPPPRPLKPPPRHLSSSNLSATTVESTVSDSSPSNNNSNNLPRSRKNSRDELNNEQNRGHRSRSRVANSNINNNNPPHSRQNSYDKLNNEQNRGHRSRSGVAEPNINNNPPRSRQNSYDELNNEQNHGHRSRSQVAHRSANDNNNNPPRSRQNSRDELNNEQNHGHRSRVEFMSPSNENNNPPHSRQNSHDELNNGQNHGHRSRSRSRHRQRREHFIVSDKYLSCMSIWCLLLSILSITMLGLSHIDLYSYTWKDRTFREKDYEVCIKCASLQYNPDESGGFRHYMNTKMVDGEILCCSSSSTQMSSLVKQVLNQQKYVPEALTPKENELHKDIPSAHKYLLKPRSYNTGIVHLDIDLKPDSHFVHSRRVGERNSALVIQHPGLYYVYSSVVYRNDIPCENMKNKTWHHYIERAKPGDIENAGALLKTAHTCCQGCSADKQTSFAGGVFRLQKNDIIYVTVTLADAIMFEPNSTYLGLVMMGSVQENSEGER